MSYALCHTPLMVKAVGDATVACFPGPQVALDERTFPPFREELSVAADEVPGDLVVDFGNVDYLSSIVLGGFVVLHKKLRTRGRRLVLCNLAPRVYEVFEVTRLTNFLDVRPSRSQGPGGALAAPATAPAPASDAAWVFRTPLSQAEIAQVLLPPARSE